MKRTGYNILASLATLALLGLVSTAIAATPTPNGVYVGPGWLRYFDDLGPPATVTLTQTPPSGMPTQVVWGYNTPFDVGGWGEKGLWQLSGDGGATHLLFPNLCNYSYEADFTLAGTNVAHAEGGIGVSPWWNDDGGPFMAKYYPGDPNDGQIVAYGGVIPAFDFTAAFGIHYTLGATVHEKVLYLAGSVEPTAAMPATVQFSVIYGGVPYSSPILPCAAANPADPPHHTYGQLDDTKLSGYVLGGPHTMNSGDPTGAGTLTGTFGDIRFQNLDGATPAHATTWGALKALYR
jgi:hypothetical protein